MSTGAGQTPAGVDAGGVQAGPIEHRFGPYGGQYVPETLMPALAELERGNYSNS